MSTQATPTPEAPKTLMEKVGVALPVGLTALATVFAGMSTGALQKAMYWKSQAAQDQAKATSQWSLAGFKRDRALIMQTAGAQLLVAAGFAKPEFVLGSAQSDDPVYQKAMAWLTEKGSKGLPQARLPEVAEEKIPGLVEAIRARQPEAALLKLAAKVSHESINSAIDEAEKATEQIDRDWDPIIKAAARLTSEVSDKTVSPATRSARLAAGYDLEERRYRVESRLNQGIGNLYEVRVKVSTAESDKHRRKSENFFYSMLGAQIGATAASLGLARKRQPLMWLLAGFVGLLAIGYGGYVFLAI